MFSVNSFGFFMWTEWLSLLTGTNRYTRYDSLKLFYVVVNACHSLDGTSTIFNLKDLLPAIDLICFERSLEG